MDNDSFGYPTQCNACKLNSENLIGLKVEPYYRPGNKFKLMLIGQDPTIFNRPERVKKVLMLDEPKGQLKKWLSDLFGEKAFSSITIYATNLVKCTFKKPPSLIKGGGLRFLIPYFQNCRQYLGTELVEFKPDLVLTLGEASHKLFRTIMDNANEIKESMQKAFTGRTIKAHYNGIAFDYSPCLHIKTFRVAETYGRQIGEFKGSIKLISMLGGNPI